MAGKKETYKKDYEVVEQLSPDGRGKKKQLVYHGKHYRFDMEDEEFKKMKFGYAALMLAILIFYILMAILPVRSMGYAGNVASPYVILPYTITLIPLGLTAAKTLLLLTRPRKMEYVDYDKYVVHLKGYTMASAICLAIIALGQLIYIIAESPEGSILYELIFAFAGILAALTAYLYYNRQISKRVKVV